MEEIPLSVVQDFDAMDDGDLWSLPCLHVKSVEEKCTLSIIRGYMEMNIGLVMLEGRIKRTGRMPGFSYCFGRKCGDSAVLYAAQSFRH